MRFNDEDGQDDEAVIEVRGQEERRKDRIQRMWTMGAEGWEKFDHSIRGDCFYAAGRAEEGTGGQRGQTQQG